MVTTLWLLTGWFATIAALLLLARICRLPSFRPLAPERRCPRCGYDLSHTKGRTCSECGHAARREWPLRLHPRRRRSLAIALLLASLTIPAQRAERIEAHGWVAGMPTTVLVLAAPWTIDAYTMNQWLFERPNFRRPASSTSHQLMEELLIRQSDPSLDLARWQEWLLVEIAGRHITSSDEPITATSGGPVTAGVSRALSEALRRDRMTPRQRRAVIDTIAITLHVPHDWPVGARTAGRLEMISWTSLGVLRITARDASSDELLDQVRFEPIYEPVNWLSTEFAGLECIWDPWITLDRAPEGHASRSYRLDFEYQRPDHSWHPMGSRTLVTTINGSRTARRGRAVPDLPELEAVLRTATLQPGPVTWPWGPVVRFDGLEAWSRSIVWSHIRAPRFEVPDKPDRLIPVRIEWCRGATVLASRAECWGSTLPASGTPHLDWLIMTRDEIYLRPRASADALSRIEPGDVLRITSDPDLALRDPRRRPHWEGVIEIKLETGPETGDR